MTLSMRNMDDGQGAVLTQSAKVCTHRVRRPPFWLIVTALDRNRYLPVYKVHCVAKTWAHTTLPTQLRRIDPVNKLWLVVSFKGKNE